MLSRTIICIKLDVARSMRTVLYLCGCDSCHAHRKNQEKELAFAQNKPTLKLPPRPSPGSSGQPVWESFHSQAGLPALNFSGANFEMEPALRFGLGMARLWHATWSGQWGATQRQARQGRPGIHARHLHPAQTCGPLGPEVSFLPLRPKPRRDTVQAGRELRVHEQVIVKPSSNRVLRDVFQMVNEIGII